LSELPPGDNLDETRQGSIQIISPGGFSMLSEIEQFQKWLRRRAPHSSTHIHYASDLKMFFTWLGKSVKDVKVRDVDAFIEHCQDEGHVAASINRRIAALCSFYRFLTLMAEDAPENPMRPKLHFLRKGLRLPRDVKDDDLERLFAVVDSPRDRAMFLLMLRCGLRVGEIRNLSMGDLYLRSLSSGLPRLWLKGKGNKERVVYLSSQALAALDAWLALRPEGKAQAVFLNRFGKRLSVTGIQSQLAAYCQRAELSTADAPLWITCHQLRHTFGRHLVEARVPVTTIQKLMGHARIHTTEIYLHISDKQVQQDYEAAMEQIMKRLALKEQTA
jgi:site-specific recombinase XerD